MMMTVLVPALEQSSHTSSTPRLTAPEDLPFSVKLEHAGTRRALGERPWAHVSVRKGKSFKPILNRHARDARLEWPRLIDATGLVSRGARGPLLGWRREGVAAFGIFVADIRLLVLRKSCLLAQPPLLSHLGTRVRSTTTSSPSSDASPDSSWSDNWLPWTPTQPSWRRPPPALGMTTTRSRSLPRSSTSPTSSPMRARGQSLLLL